MAFGRGRGAAKEAQEKQQSNRTSFSRVFTMEPGESALLRFRGTTRAQQAHPDLPDFQVPELADLIDATGRPDQAKMEKLPRPLLVAVARRLGIATSVLEDDGAAGNKQTSGFTQRKEAPATPAQLAARIRARWSHLEPFVCSEHYIANNFGDGRRSYQTCGVEWTPKSQCACCQAKANGDRRISNKVANNFSIVPRRLYHYVKGQGNNKSTFAYCTNYGPDANGACTYCARGDEAKQEGSQRFPLAPTHAEGVFAAADRMSKKCAACFGQGKIAVVGYSCAKCTEPLDNITSLDNKVRCSEPSCRYEGFAVEIIKCEKGCKTPRRAHLFDGDILVQRLGGGKQTSYSFTEEWPLTAAPENVLRFALPDWEATLKPASVETQCQQIGLMTNPFTGQPVSAPPPRGARNAGGGEDYVDPDAGGEPPQDVQYD
jgi:hypothetical protein